VRVVIDTNVLLSAVMSPLGVPGAIFRAWRSGRFALVVSPALLAELKRTLAYPRIRIRTGWGEEEEDRFLQLLADDAMLVEPTGSLSVSRDPDDDRVLEAAEAGGADYIVSGDEDLLTLREHRGSRIVSPAQFAALLDGLDR